MQWGLVEAGQVSLMEVQMLSSLAILQAAFRQGFGLLYSFTGLQVANPQLKEYGQLWAQVVLNCKEGD